MEHRLGRKEKLFLVKGKWGLAVVYIIVSTGLLAAFGCAALQEARRVRSLPIEDIGPGCVPDGAYDGSFSHGGFIYRVEVGVFDHCIQWVEIVSNRDNPYARKAERVVDRILAQQTANVDAVSGATTTSKALLKAVENALLGAGGCQ
jgi:uncharacterized protein with FMN-binding domain